MDNADMPAMPQPIAANNHEVVDTTEYNSENGGVTKREHFAGLIMASLAGTNRYMGRHAAESAVQWADALLTELNKGE